MQTLCATSGFSTARRTFFGTSKATMPPKFLVLLPKDISDDGVSTSACTDTKNPDQHCQHECALPRYRYLRQLTQVGCPVCCSGATQPGHAPLSVRGQASMRIKELGLPMSRSSQQPRSISPPYPLLVQTLASIDGDGDIAVSFDRTTRQSPTYLPEVGRYPPTYGGGQKQQRPTACGAGGF